MTVNRRTHGMRRRAGEPPAGGGGSRGERDRHRRTQAERREHTRRALLDAALNLMDGGEGFESLSLRSVTRAAGVVPAAFYRHFQSMDELGLALVDESFRTLRAMLRDARSKFSSSRCSPTASTSP
jgi:AcrR family transcriptional regulator